VTSCRPTLSGLHVTKRRTADRTEIDDRRRTGEVWPDHEDRSPRCSTRRVRCGGDLRRGCTSRGPGGGGHKANPKARSGPPRADAPDGGRGDIATEPPRATMASHRDGSRERAASSLPETAHESMTGRSFPPSASLRPGSPKKASRCIAASPSDVRPTRERDTKRWARLVTVDRCRSKARGKPRDRRCPFERSQAIRRR